MICRMISDLNEKLSQTKRDIDIQTADVSKQKAARDAMVGRRVVASVTN